MSLKPHLFYVCHAGCIKEIGLHIVGTTVLFLFCGSYLAFGDRIWPKRYKVITLANVFELVQSAFYSLSGFRHIDICLQDSKASKQQKKSLSCWKNIGFCNKAFHLENVIFNNIKAQNSESKQIKSRPRTEAMSIRR